MRNEYYYYYISCFFLDVRIEHKKLMIDFKMFMQMNKKKI